MHCLLLVASTRATYGPLISSILWKHLLDKTDPSSFVEFAKAMQSKTTNAGAFLAALAANPEMRENAELSKALAEMVSEMDEVVRDGVLSPEGFLSMPPEKSMFAKLVALTKSSSCADTRLFQLTDEPDDAEQVHLRALTELKEAHLAELSKHQQ